MDTQAMRADVPEEIHTGRLHLRAVRPEDAEASYRAVVDSRDRLLPWMPWAVPEPTLEASQAFARLACANFVLRKELNYSGFLREGTRDYVMGLGMHAIDWSVPRFEIGYWVRTGYEGKGLVREAVEALTDVAFSRLGAVRVEIRCDAQNKRSARVAEACGYTLEATMKSESRTPAGALRDTLVFARVAAFANDAATGR